MNNNKPMYPSAKKTAWSFALVLISIVVNILAACILIYISNYSALSKNVFIWLNVGILVALLVIDVLVFISVRQMNKIVSIISSILLCVCLIVCGYGSYVCLRIQANIDSMTAVDQVQEVNCALVIYSGSSTTPILDETDLAGKKIGVATNSNTGTIAKRKLESEGITAEYVEYSGYSDVYRALIGGDIECATLPITWESLMEEDVSVTQFVKDCSALLTITDQVNSTNQTGADKDLTKEPFTILLTGQNEGLADTIMLISVNPISMKVTMTSIARDSYVPISCYGGGSSKINDAHASSEECMVATVEQLTGIDIDYTVEFNFASVVQVVDAVGGVDVDITEEFDAQCWDIVNDELVVYHLWPGNDVHLDGARALGFARERYAFADGDFARQRHQQEIIDQVLTKIMATKNPDTILKVMDAAGENIITNFTREQLVNFISYAMKKADRYYGDSLEGVFNIVHSRIMGYDSSVYNASLDMDLYIYKLYDQSIYNTKAAVDRNMDLNYPIGESTPVNWSAAEEFEVPDISE